MDSIHNIRENTKYYIHEKPESATKSVDFKENHRNTGVDKNKDLRLINFYLISIRHLEKSHWQHGRNTALILNMVNMFKCTRKKNLCYCETL